MSSELIQLSATELIASMRSRRVSPVEVVEAFLRQIDETNPRLNAIVTIADDVIDRARAAEAELMKSEDPRALLGLPITIKDTIDTKGLRTTSGTRLCADRVPDRDATVVGRLRSSGAIILGKTNVPEMAAYYECVNPVFGRTNNPCDLNRTSGGSSGGEAAAIAAHLSPAGIGSDLSGSIRLPAHFCGIAGLKPTAGSVPLGGHSPAMSGPLLLGGTIGPMARAARDLKLLFDVMADRPAPAAPRELAGLRAACYVDDAVAPVDHEIALAVERTADVLRDAGIEVDRAQAPTIEHGLRLWIELFSNYFLTGLKEFYSGYESDAGPEVAAMLGRAKADPASREAKIGDAERRARAIVEREGLREELLRWMKATPILIAPVGSTCAFEHGEQRVHVNGESISVFRAFSYSQTFNVFGLPSVAVPVGCNSQGLPIGVQVVGLPNAESAILAVAEIIESALTP